MSVKNFYSRFRAFTVAYGLLDDCEQVIIGLSGGVDSMVLLQLLQTYVGRKPINLLAVHINHGLRGQQSEKDQQFVSEYCREKAIDLVIRRVPVRDYARTNHISLEMAGRELRYQVFQEIARQYSQAVIATAHTLDDQAETVLLRICKGTSLAGLAGIPIRRENIIRPLLFARKAELYEYARVKKIPYREDRTNFQSAYQRNFLRNDIIPLLQKKINPKIVETLGALANQTVENNAVISGQLQTAWKQAVLLASEREIILDISKLTGYFTAIEKAILLEAYRRVATTGGGLSNGRLTALLKLIHFGQTGQCLHLGGTITATINRQHLHIGTNQVNDWPDAQIRAGEQLVNESFTIRTAITNRDEYEVAAHQKGTEYFDLKRVGPHLTIRHWQRGDSMRPLGMSKTKKVSDIFIDLKVPRWHKHQIPVIANGEKIIWLCGLVIADDFKITAETEKVLKIMYREN